MRIAICDDEEKERNNLSNLINKYCTERQLVYELATFSSGEELIKTGSFFHIIFLDISMKELNGIETGKEIYKRNHKTKIVYVTSYHEYCSQALNTAHAFAYLTKPIQLSDFLEQFGNLVYEIIETEKQEIKVEFYNVQEIKNDVITEKYIAQIPVDDIAYFEYVKSTRKINIHKKNAVYVVSNTMTEIEKKMKIYGFEVPCRGFLINLGWVQKIKGFDIYLQNNIVLPVSQKRIMAIKDALNEYIQRSK